ncbi:hypothetical protein [Streptomyces nigra]|uniref:hypothetical protein n=1 Tax=Streptomyces nigra TaxID=1827580 RepID=UPI003819B61E
MLPAHKLEIGTEPLAEPARNSVCGQPFLDPGEDSRYWDAPQPVYPAPFWRVLIQSRGAQPAPEAEPSIRAFPLTLRSFVDQLPACPDRCDPAVVWPVNQH